ncbi:MAG: HIT domain-containing protein [Candidatus Uhrbacteria bacterium]
MRRIPFPKDQIDQYIEECARTSCFICDIVEGKDIRKKHHIIFEDDQTIVFLSNKPTQYGHVLVCPKKHVEQLASDLNEADYLELQTVAHRTNRVVSKVVEHERLYIASFGSQQMNSHIHFHVVPIPPGTPIREQQMASMMPELVGYLELEESEWKELTNKLRQEF